MSSLIENLTKQLKKVKREHTEVNKDTYWRGVMIGLETAINVAKEKELLLPSNDDIHSEAYRLQSLMSQNLFDFDFGSFKDGAKWMRNFIKK